MTVQDKNNKFEVKDRVRDRDDIDGGEAVVVDCPSLTIDKVEIETEDGEKPVSEVNPYYNSSDPAVTVCFKRELNLWVGWKEEDPEKLFEGVKDRGLKYYIYPESRLIPSEKQDKEAKRSYVELEELEINGVQDIPYLHSRFKNYFENEGIEDLYPPQKEAVRNGVTAGENLLASIPTASGKTFISLLGMLSRAPGQVGGSKSLYIVPLRALAREKMEEFEQLPGVDVGLSIGDYDEKDEELGENDIIVATSEKVDSLIRNSVSWIKDLTTVVADEIHLLDDGERGPTLEVTLSKIRELNPRVQIIGLSATVSNADDVAEWLDAYLLESSWRPIDLRRGVYNHKKQEIEFENHENKDIEKDLVTDPTVSLVNDSVGAEGQVLVFVAHRKDTMELAKNLKQLSLDGCEEIADKVMENAEAEVGKILASCIRDGVAFHHAGLDREQKKLVEKGFRERKIKAIAATPSLAAGVNVPARRVVVRDVSRYEGDGYVDIPILQVQQMFGRAGRPGLDPYGEAVLVSSRKNSVDELRDRYIEGEPEQVFSKLANEKVLRKHVLATVSNRFAETYKELLEFISGTFYAYQESEETIESQLKEVVGGLDSIGMVSLKLGNTVEIKSTELGDLVSKLYLDPVTADRFIETLEAVEDGEITATSRTWLQTVSESPDIYNFWLGYSDDKEKYHRYAVEELESEVVDTLDSSVKKHLDVYKTTRVLSDWISGTDVEELTDKYDLFPGDIRNRTERARWILYGAKAIAGFATTDQDIIDSIGETHDRVVYGVDSELLDLVEVDEVGRVRARSLYRRGIRNKQDLLDSPRSRLETILGARTAEKVLESLD